MRTAMLGCGAMGTILGAYLARAGCPVDLIDRADVIPGSPVDREIRATGVVLYEQ